MVNTVQQCISYCNASKRTFLPISLSSPFHRPPLRDGNYTIAFGRKNHWRNTRVRYATVAKINASLQTRAYNYTDKRSWYMSRHLQLIACVAPRTRMKLLEKHLIDFFIDWFYVWQNERERERERELYNNKYTWICIYIYLYLCIYFICPYFSLLYNIYVLKILMLFNNINCTHRMYLK